MSAMIVTLCGGLKGLLSFPEAILLCLERKWTRTSDYFWLMTLESINYSGVVPLLSKPNGVTVSHKCCQIKEHITTEVFNTKNCQNSIHRDHFRFLNEFPAILSFDRVLRLKSRQLSP